MIIPFSSAELTAAGEAIFTRMIILGPGTPNLETFEWVLNAAARLAVEKQRPLVQSCYEVMSQRWPKGPKPKGFFTAFPS